MLSKSQMALVLGKAAAFDQRTLGDADVEAWRECLGDKVDFDTAMERVTQHYRVSADRLMPVHLLDEDSERQAPWEQPGYDSGDDGPAF